MTFWERIQSLCSQKSISPTALCKSLGLSTSMVTRWKNGTIPNEPTMEILAEALGVTAHYLMWGDATGMDIQHFSKNEKEPTVSVDPKLLSLIDSMSAEELADLEKYAEFILSRKKGG